jgi:uncharacterized membrane protein YdjX (TVP38/TMEM64 family)
MKFPFRKIFYATLLIVTMAGAYFMLINSGFANLFSDLDLLVMRIRELGILGPMLVIGLMVLAIVFNPLPSAPIALAAGAVYAGTLLELSILLPVPESVQ